MHVDLDLDFGSDDEFEALVQHLGERALGADDVVEALTYAVLRRKGSRIFGYGRAVGGQPIVVVLAERGSRWRPKTAWPMNTKEQRWWREHGGR